MPVTYGIEGFSENGEYPLAAGTVKGYRDWYITLVARGAVTYNVPGASVPVTGKWEAQGIIGAYGGVWENAGWHEAACGNPPWARAHDAAVPVPADNCGCGFWAYWSPISQARIQVDTPTPVFIAPDPFSPVISLSHEHAPSWARVTLTGIAEGAGRTIIGTKGFRCQKMRVLAIAPYMDAESWFRLARLLNIPAAECASLVMTRIAKVMKGIPVLPDHRDIPPLQEEQCR